MSAHERSYSWGNAALTSSQMSRLRSCLKAQRWRTDRHFVARRAYFKKVASQLYGGKYWSLRQSIWTYRFDRTEGTTIGTRAGHFTRIQVEQPRKQSHQRTLVDAPVSHEVSTVLTPIHQFVEHPLLQIIKLFELYMEIQ
jgi:hypothetical protein